MSTQDLYSVLQVSPSASSQEIRKSYQRLVKECHPDRLGTEVSESERALAVEKFHTISKAYKVLGEETQRLAYDTVINAGVLTQKWPISDTVDLDDMTFNPEKETFSLGCRCGGRHTISETDMEDGVDIVSCCTCTLSIKVIYVENNHKQNGDVD